MTTDDLTIDYGSGCTGTATALLFEDAIEYGVWEALTKRLLLSGRASPWWIGDALNAGEAWHGESYAQVVDESGYEFGTLSNYQTVARRFDPDSRIRFSGLPWGYFQAAAVLTEEQAAALLQEALDGREEEPEEWKLVNFRARVKHARSHFKPDDNGYTDEEPTEQEQIKLAAGDRCDVTTLEDSPWPSDEIDLIVTSPPYGIGKEYADGGDVAGWDAYLDAVTRWATVLLRLVNPRHGRLALNVSLDRSDNAGQVGRPAFRGRPLYATWVSALLDVGFTYRSSVIWWDNQSGEGTQRGSVDSPSAPHIIAPVEMVALLYRGTWSRSSERAHDLSHVEWLDLGPRGVWQFNGEHDDDHPAVFPVELPDRLIRLLSFRGDLIADPFCGRGTVGTAAARLGRRVWLADRSQKYVDLARSALLEARGLVVEAVA